MPISQPRHRCQRTDEIAEAARSHKNQQLLSPYLDMP
jgi:hypothetical protein